MLSHHEFEEPNLTVLSNRLLCSCENQIVFSRLEPWYSLRIAPFRVRGESHGVEGGLFSLAYNPSVSHSFDSSLPRKEPYFHSSRSNLIPHSALRASHSALRIRREAISSKFYLDFIPTGFHPPWWISSPSHSTGTRLRQTPHSLSKC